MSLLYPALFIIPFLLFVGPAAYNLLFHPLRNYPGPAYTAASSWLWYFQRLSGNQAYWLAALHRRYGDVVRVAPNHLSYVNGEAWKDIYGHRTSTGRGNLPKDLSVYTSAVVRKNPIIMLSLKKSAATHFANVNSRTSANDEDHTRVRRSIAHAFSDKALVEEEPLIQRYTGLLVEKLRDAVSVSDNGSSPDMVCMYIQLHHVRHHGGPDIR